MATLVSVLISRDVGWSVRAHETHAQTQTHRRHPLRGIGRIRGSEERIDVQIAEIRKMLDGGGTDRSEAAKPKRRVSAAARRRMAKAQRLRWKKIKQKS
jgi:hypothetical protein